MLKIVVMPHSLTRYQEIGSKYVVFFFVILYDGHVLHLRSDTVAICRWMRNGLDDYDDQMVPRDKYRYGICLIVEGKPGKNHNQETDLTGHAIQRYWLIKPVASEQGR